MTKAAYVAPALGLPAPRLQAGASFSGAGQERPPLLVVRGHVPEQPQPQPGPVVRDGTRVIEMGLLWQDFASQGMGMFRKYMQP